MGKRYIKVTALNLFIQFQVLLGHLEKHFDVPAFSLNKDDLFVGQVDVRGHQRQPVLFRPVLNEDQFNVKAISQGDN